MGFGTLGWSGRRRESLDMGEARQSALAVASASVPQACAPPLSMLLGFPPDTDCYVLPWSAALHP